MMRSKYLNLFLLIFISPLLLISQENYFTLDPVLSPDATTVVFHYNGDLWKVSAEGGEASRITAMDGMETRPHFSPDGRWIAFSGTQNGNRDIFIMPANGGEIRQLTYHQGWDDVDGWSWDSKSIYFTSNRYNRMSGYSILAEGGTPERLFPHYFNTVHNITEHPNGDIYFNESWESKNFAHRKRYKGDYNPDIKSISKDGTFTKHTDYMGKDFATTIDKDGNVFFVSDEANGEYNLYTFENGNKKQLTNFETSVYWPKVSANGEKIVFRKDYQTYIYDVNSGASKKLDLKLFKSNVLDKSRDYKTAGNISDFDISDDKKKIAFTSRGKLFISDIEGKFIKEIPTDQKEAVRSPRWLKDNKTILYAQTDGGYYNWFTIAADGPGEAIQHTSDEQNNRNISFNSDKSKAVYLSGRNEVRVMDLESMESKTIAEEELWAIYNPLPRFSPDDRYVAFTAYDEFEQDILLYDLEKEELTNLSHTMVTETQPFWSPDGKYLYYSSDRLNPGYPYGTRESHIYRVMLDKYEDPFKSEKIEDLFEEEKETKEDEDQEPEEDGSTSSEDEDEGAAGDETKNGADEGDEAEITVSINMDGIYERIERVSPSFGEQGSPYVMQKGDKTIVLYISDHEGGSPNLWMTTYEPFESSKTEKISDERITGMNLREVDGSLYILDNGNIHSLDPGKKKLNKININHTFRKNLENEFQQMFYEAWAGFGENFYSEDFHGQDWNALKERYASYLPYVSSRFELRRILNDMLGELNTSHFGFYSSGSEESLPFGDNTLATGIEFRNAEPYTVERVVSRSPADVKDKDVQAGDVLIAVNGVEVDPTKNREMYFTRPSIDDEIHLTFDRNGESIEVKIHPTSYGAISNLVYDEWQDENHAYVSEKSDGKIAYVHMKNMGRGEFNQFMHYMVREGAYKDGLILDLRYNTGGNVHDDVLRFLSRKAYLKWKYREGDLATQSNFGVEDRPVVLLINEQSLSDAEMTAAGFKQLGLGTIVGTETYRWIIFTSGQGLVDGSFYRLPSWGCYTLDGKNLEKTGVTPDVRVEKDFKQRLENEHPQLDKAIEIIGDKMHN